MSREFKQWHPPGVTITRSAKGWTIWIGIGGHKPLAHLPRWRRHLFHLPSIRWRLWPRPFRKSAYNRRGRRWLYRVMEAERRNEEYAWAVEKAREVLGSISQGEAS
jgi:hypothetical protein